MCWSVLRLGEVIDLKSSYIAQKPNVKLPRIVQTSVLEQETDILAWHMLISVSANGDGHGQRGRTAESK